MEWGELQPPEGGAPLPSLSQGGCRRLVVVVSGGVGEGVRGSETWGGFPGLERGRAIETKAPSRCRPSSLRTMQTCEWAGGGGGVRSFLPPPPVRAAQHTSGRHGLGTRAHGPTPSGSHNRAHTHTHTHIQHTGKQRIWTTPIPSRPPRSEMAGHPLPSPPAR
jgi:hypothetical protein